MKKIFILFTLLSIVTISFAQSNHTTHTIVKGETLSSLAKKYHSSVGDIMRLNNMNDKSVLRTGQKIKIPSKQTKETTAKTTTAKPVATETATKKTTTKKQQTVHTVGSKETLYAIGKKYNVSVNQIKEWNHLTADNIRGGQKLVIYPTATEDIKTEITPAKNTVAETAIAAKTIQPEPQLTKPTETATKQPEEKTIMADFTVNPKQENTVKEDYSKVSSKGYFATQYTKGKNELSGDAGILKSSSGWEDKKYYILINSIEANSIVKISSNNKTIYAKVLGPLPDIKEDNGLLLRLSNAAAASLDINETRFNVTVSY
jgi:LysM repeat protein